MHYAKDNAIARRLSKQLAGLQPFLIILWPLFGAKTRDVIINAWYIVRCNILWLFWKFQINSRQTSFINSRNFYFSVFALHRATAWDKPRRAFLFKSTREKRNKLLPVNVNKSHPAVKPGIYTCCSFEPIPTGKSLYTNCRWKYYRDLWCSLVIYGLWNF